MDGMNETVSPRGQLPLLEPSAMPAALRLDARTRRIGLAGVAHAKALLADQARRRAEREAEAVEGRRHPPHHPAAA
jgi:hypothetical protein